ncbi:protocatechuate 3,4-dioxygenase beta subunit [Bradyrhizobium japonicum]
MTLLYPLQSLAAHPARLSPDYRSTVKRSPQKPLIPMRHTLSELTGPVYGHETVRAHDNDLTIQAKGEPLGERIIVHGHVLDEDGRGVPNTLVELWQANACGRYIHVVDQHPAPLDPNFTGAGRAQTDAQGYYKFTTIKPGAYPWGNHHNAWRPRAHPFLGVRPFLHLASRHADVFPRRSPVSVRSDLQFGDRRKGAGADDLVLRSREHQAGMGAVLPLRYRAARAECHADGDQVSVEPAP